jgi:hypothetical protein
MTKQKEKEFTFIKMEHLTLDNGIMINNTDMEIKNGLMGHNMKEIIFKE